MSSFASAVSQRPSPPLPTTLLAFLGLKLPPEPTQKALSPPNPPEPPDPPDPPPTHSFSDSLVVVVSPLHSPHLNFATVLDVNYLGSLSLLLTFVSFTEASLAFTRAFTAVCSSCSSSWFQICSEICYSLVGVQARSVGSVVSLIMGLLGLIDQKHVFDSSQPNIHSTQNRCRFCRWSPFAVSFNCASQQIALQEVISATPTTPGLPCDLLQDVRSGFVRAKQQTGALSTVWSLAPTTPGLPCDLLQDVRLGFVRAQETLSPLSLPKRGTLPSNFMSKMSSK